MQLNTLSLALLSANLAPVPVWARYNLNLSPDLFSGLVTADFSTPSLDQSDLDAPKLDRINATSFDWWYFDAVDAVRPNTSIAVSFSSAGPSSGPVPLPQPPTNATHANSSAPEVLSVNVWMTFPDGRAIARSLPVSGATVSGSGDTSMGTWNGSGSGGSGSGTGSWVGSEEGYEVEVNLEGGRMRGRISLEKITPPHSHCSTPATASGNGFNTSLALGPLGWVAALPDAIASVEMEVDGERVRFEGYGYHDKNWSNKPFATSTKSLVRGHAHLGVYSIVWVAYLPSDSNSDSGMLVSAYVARDGETVNAGCAAGSVGMRAVTEETEGGPVSGYEVVVPGARLQVATDVAVEVAGDGLGRRVRYNGRARGNVLGVDEEGVAFWESFTY